MNKLPKGWVEASIRDVTTPFQTLDPTTQPTTEFLYVDIGAIDSRFQVISGPKTFVGREAPTRARRVIRTGDTLFSTVRTHLKNVALVPKELDGAIASTGIAVLRPNQIIYPSYLYNWIRSKIFIEEMSKKQDGTLYPAVTDKDVANGRILLAPLVEQQRIASKIEELMARTDRARKGLDRIPFLIAQYKRRILTTAMNGDLTPKFRADFKAGWTRSKLADIASLFDGPFGSNLKSSDYSEDGVRVVRLENIGRMKFLATRQTYIPLDKARLLERNLLKADDLVLASFVTDEIRVCLIPDELHDLAVNKADCFCIRLDTDKCIPKFLMYLLSSVLYFEILKEKVHGSTRPRIALKALKQLEVHLPRLEEQAAIVRHLESAFNWLDRMIEDHGAASQLVPRLNESILIRAFQGDIVPQHADDEPADALLARFQGGVQVERKYHALSEPDAIDGRNRVRKISQSSSVKLKVKEVKKNRQDEDVFHKPFLAGLIRTKQTKNTLELYRMSELSVADFYKQLSWELKSGFILDQGEELGLKACE